MFSLFKNKTVAKKKNKEVPVLSGEVSALDKRGHEVTKFQDDHGIWYVEKNNNGAMYAVPCKDEKEATDLFTQYVEQD